MSKITLVFAVPLLLALSGCLAEAPHSAPAPGAVASLAASTPAPVPSATPTVTLPATATLPPPTATAVPSLTPTAGPPGIPTAVVVPTLVDVPRLAGYGSVGSRVLAQPAAVVRDGITLAVEQAAVYADRVELVYTVRDIPHAALFDPFLDDPSLSCYGPDSYPNLLLPDGTVIYPENYLLDGRARGINEPFAASYLIHLYRAAIPAEVQTLTLFLRCLELVRLDVAPLDWYVPFSLVAAGL